MSGVLDVLCPMHARLDDTGHIRHLGPTLAKVFRGDDPRGRRFLEAFELLRPRGVTSMRGLLEARGLKLHLRLRGHSRSSLKGVLVPLPESAGGGAVVNLAFGISVMDAVREFSLTNADFAATDLTIEMLYLIEAKSAAMAASRTLNQRLQGARIAAEEQAFTDTLTGLKNRRAMDHVLDRYIGAGQEFALMQLDLDHFKAVNDTLGHGAGDHVLQHVARVLVDETRADDTVVRVGGDEFILILRGAISRRRVSAIARRVIARLEQPIPYDDATCRISASAGTVLSSDYDIPDAESMIADADVALYASKSAGRAQHRFFKPSMRRPGKTRAGA